MAQRDDAPHGRIARHLFLGVTLSMSGALRLVDRFEGPDLPRGEKG